MSITIYELKKILTRPIILAVIAGAFLLNLYILLIGGTQYDEQSAQRPAFMENIAYRFETETSYAGAITEEWVKSFQAEQEEFLSDPSHLIIDDEQREQIIQKYGLSEEEASNPRWFITEEARAEFQKFEDLEFSADFYSYARETGETLAEYYLQTKPNPTGQILADAAREYYNHLADDYTAYYNYNLGYQKTRNMLTVYPITVGIIIIAGISGIFCSEYSQKTDALILSCALGKRRLALAKITAGLLFSLGAWLLITAANILTILLMYSYVGFEAYWQNYVIDYAPYLWNSGQITIIAALTSLFGAIYLTFVTTTVSVCCKNRVTALILSCAILLFPLTHLYYPNAVISALINRFSPTVLLKGISVWQSIDFVCLFGHAVPIHAVIAAVCTVLIAVMPWIILRRFHRHQVEN